MNKLKTMIELLSYKQTLNKELTELQSKLKPIQENINSLNDQISISKELHDFLCEKILETYTENELEEVGKYRKKIHPNPWIPRETYYVNSKVFDPFNDEWYICDYEQKEGKIRFMVSCRKNEGSISGLMTFLDTHYTDWIEISELEMLEDGV